MPAEVRERTLIVFVGDNGTPPDATTLPFRSEHAKGSVYEGGINVPLILAGPGVARGAECAGLVQLTDLFATVAELLGQPDTSPDSVSMVPYLAEPGRASLREWVHSERFLPNGTGPREQSKRCVRGERYKLIRMDGPDESQELFSDLPEDPFERDDLTRGPHMSAEAREALQRLTTVLDGLDEGD